jgi:hypothetical protein
MAYRCVQTILTCFGIPGCLSLTIFAACDVDLMARGSLDLHAYYSPSWYLLPIPLKWRSATLPAHHARLQISGRVSLLCSKSFISCLATTRECFAKASTMSFTHTSPASKPAACTGLQGLSRVARLNCMVAMIKVSIPTKEELEMACSHETRQSMRIPETATETDDDRSMGCALKRM